MAENVTIEALEIEISHKSTGAESAVRGLTNALKSLKNVVGSNGIVGLRKVAEQISEISKAINELPDLSNLRELSDILEKLKSVGNVEIKLDISNASKATSARGQLSPYINPESSGEGRPGYSYVGQTINAKYEEIREEARRATVDYSDLTEETEKTSGGEKGSSSASFISKMWDSIKRIAFYRAIRAAISAVTSAMKEGVNNAYQWAKANGDAFADVMDSISSKTLVMKNQLGGLFAGIITTLQPVIEWLISAVTKVAEALSFAWSFLTGQSTYLKANTGAMQEYASATGSAAAAMKDLMGFDEINRLSSHSSSGSGYSNTSVDDYFTRADTMEYFNGLSESWQDLLEVLEDVSDATGDVIDLFGEASDAARGGVESAAEFAEGILGDMDDIFTASEEDFDGYQNYCETGLNTFLDGAFTDYLESIRSKYSETNYKNYATSDQYAEKTRAAWADKVADMYAKEEEFKTNVSKCWESIKTVIENVCSAMRTAWDTTISDYKQKWGDFIRTSINPAIDSINKVFGTNFSKISILSSYETTGKSIKTTTYKNADGYALGGFPTQGDLFIANEQGAEMVGTLGGRTAVANNEEIVQGISQGVYKAMVTANGGQNITVNVDGKSLFDIMVNRNNSTVRRTGSSPLLT